MQESGFTKTGQHLLLGAERVEELSQKIGRQLDRL